MRRLLIDGCGGIAERTAPRVAALAKGGSLPQHLVNCRPKRELRLKLDYPTVLHGSRAAAQKNG
jgi:hypothetical protein